MAVHAVDEVLVSLVRVSVRGDPIVCQLVLELWHVLDLFVEMEVLPVSIGWMHHTSNRVLPEMEEVNQSSMFVHAHELEIFLLMKRRSSGIRRVVYQNYLQNLSSLQHPMKTRLRLDGRFDLQVDICVLPCKLLQRLLDL
jgi:hypothetical protein